MFRESRSKLEKDAKTHSDDKIGAGFAHKSKNHQVAKDQHVLLFYLKWIFERIVKINTTTRQPNKIKPKLNLK